MKRLIGISALAAMVMTSCTEDSTLDVVGNLVDDNSIFLATVATDDSGREWAVEDEVGVFQYSGSETLHSNVKYYNASYNSSFATFKSDDADNTLYYIDDVAEVMLYYPYSSELGSGDSISLDLTDQGSVASTVYYSTETTTLTKGSEEALVFVNRLDFPRLAFNFTMEDTSGSGEMVAADMTDAVITLSGLSTTGSYNTSTSTMSANSVTATITGITCDGSISYVSVLPQSVASTEVVTLVVSSPVFGYCESELTLGTLVEGGVSAFDVTLAEATMTVSAGDIANWGDGGSVSGNAYATGEVVYVDGVSIDAVATTTITVGGQITFTATVTPPDAMTQDVTWTSSDTTVATFAGNTLTAVGKGETIVTVTTTDGGFTASCTIEVVAPVVSESVEVGNFLYSDLSHSTTLDLSKNLLGVVYSVSEDGKSGMIMNINTAKYNWATSGTTYATSLIGTSTSTSDLGIGVANMKIVASKVGNDFTDHPAFAYVDSFNDPDLDYSTLSDDATGVWALPSEGDIKGFVPGILADGDSSVINSSIEAAGGVKISNPIHFSTCIEISTNVNNHRCVYYNDSNTQSASGIIKTNEGLWVRPVMAFNVDDSPYYSAHQQ